MLILCHLSQNSQLLRSPYDQHYLAAQIVLGEPCKKHWRIKTEMTLRLAECQKAFSEASSLSLFSTAPVCSSYIGNHCMIGKFLFTGLQPGYLYSINSNHLPSLKPLLSFVSCVNLFFSPAGNIFKSEAVERKNYHHTQQLTNK